MLLTNLPQLNRSGNAFESIRPYSLTVRLLNDSVLFTDDLAG